MDIFNHPFQSSSTSWTPPKRAPQHHVGLRLPLLDLPSPETDTLIYLSPISAPSPPLRCSSRKLLAAGSPVFEKLLGPTCQFRLLRRKNLLKLGLPMGIKFVVDLSPPEEGDEAVEMIEKLWCPDEVLSWKSHLEGYVEPDDPDVYQEQDMETGIADTNATGDWHPWHSNSSKQSSAVSALPSYSATRHTAAIERVLHILHGLDPRIHTTPMWYTVHKVAVQLQCTEAVQDYILSWLYGNLDFTESHPALVLGIAAEVQNQTLFRDTFALIVGTQALCGHIDNASDQATESDDKVPEPWRKPILFARRSLQAKLNRLYEHISSAAWLDNATMIPEYAKLVSPLNNPTVPQRWKKLAHDLDRAIRADIDVALTQLFSSPEDPGNPRSGLYRLPRDRQIYSRGYWQELQHLRQRVPVLGTEVMGLLSGWEGAAQGFLGDTQEPGTDIEVERMLERPIAEWYGWEEDGCEIAATHRQSVLEVRESQVNENRKGKSKAAFEPASEPDSQLSLSRTSSYKWFNDQATQRRKRRATLKKPSNAHSGPQARPTRNRLPSYKPPPSSSPPTSPPPSCPSWEVSMCP